MSIYTSQSFCEACFERLRAVDPSIEVSIIPRLRVMLAPALEMLAGKVSASKERNLLVKTLGNVTVASGTAPLAALVSAATPMLIDDQSVLKLDIVDSDGRKLQMLRDNASLTQDSPTEFPFGAVQGTTLYTANVADGNLSVTGSYIETDVANLPTQLIPMLFEEMQSAWMKPA